MRGRVVLVGLPGVGKTTVGRRLAEMQGVAFVDLDDVIEARTGRTPAALLRAVGERAFRDAEAAALAAVLATPGTEVVATGGGAVSLASSRALLAAEPFVVHLCAGADVLVGRLEGGDRPLLGEVTTEGIEALAEARAAWYAEVADVVVDASGPIDEVCARLDVAVATT